MDIKITISKNTLTHELAKLIDALQNENETAAREQIISAYNNILASQEA